jgi:hypothetical protein
MNMKYNMFKHAAVPVPTEHLIAIGKITVNYGALESCLKHIIWDIVGGQRLGQVITSDLTFNALIDQANSLFIQNYKNKHLRDELWNILSGPVRRAQSKRNQIIHATWGKKGDAVKMFTVKANKKTGYSRSNVDVTVEDLVEIADFIASTSHKLSDFRLHRMLNEDVNPEIKNRPPRRDN